MMAKTLQDFSTEDLINWVDSIVDDGDQIFGTQDARKDMKKIFSDSNVTGKMLSNCTDTKSAKNLLKNWTNDNNKCYLKGSLSSAVNRQIEIDNNIKNDNKEDENDEAAAIAKMKAAMEEQRAAREFEQKNSLGSKKGGNTNEQTKGTIKIAYQLDGSQIQTLKHLFSSDDTVALLVEMVCHDSGIRIENNNREGDKVGVGLKWKGRNMQEDKTLGELGFLPNEAYNPHVTVYFRVIGGSYDDDEKHDSSKNKNGKSVSKLDENNDKRQRLPDFASKTGIKASLKPDCIMGYDSKNQLRVEMPCGHVFASKTIFRLAKMYGTNILADGISCPMADCGDIWDYNAVIAAGDFDENETNYFANLFEKRKLLRSGNVKECGGCGSFVTLPDELGKIRVHCPRDQCKNRSDFCWACGKDWKGGGFSLCGNKDCSSMSINEELKNCKMIKPQFLDGMECPELRACPRCLKLCEWDSHCKHITCWGCKIKFCFVCLSVRDSKTNLWPQSCGGFATSCQLKERQQLKN